VVASARTLDRLGRDAAAKAVWRELYPRLSAGQAGLLGAVTSRSEAQVLRLSTLYAVLDGAAEVRIEHLLAGLAVWEYSAASARYIFGASSGDRLADQLLAMLEEAPEGLSLTEIQARLGRNYPAHRLQQALASLDGEVQAERRLTGGRPQEHWRRVAGEGAARPGESLVEQAVRLARQHGVPLPDPPASEEAPVPASPEMNE
jgi:hypothetical protein